MEDKCVKKSLIVWLEITAQQVLLCQEKMFSPFSGMLDEPGLVASHLKQLKEKPHL